jgi:peptidoglycan/LPS O-acetylase OafA/YrhL
MQKPRLVGVDLCRGIAAYAVVLLHSGDQSWGYISPLASEFRSLFYFAVPFFLATSFHFSMDKVYTGLTVNYWKQRFQRIIIPYIIWTIFYLFSKILIFTINRQPDKIKDIFLDPVSIIFFGGASLQLYYLPILIIGTCSLIIAEYLVKRHTRVSVLALLSIISTLIYNFFIVSGNDFQLGPNVAFQNIVKFIAPNANEIPLLRIIFVQIAFLIRCLPYLFIAMIFQPLMSKQEYTKYVNFITLCLFVFFIIVCSYGKLFLPIAVQELFLGYSLLILGIYLSKYIKNNNLITSLGFCSFGIYLIHTIFINIFQIIIGKNLPVLMNQITVFSILMFSICSFLLSWIAVYFMSKNKFIAKYVFGT